MEAGAGLSGPARQDLERLCKAASYDGACVGFRCAVTEPREALECLVAGNVDPRVWRSLVMSENPNVVAYAAEALTRTDQWTAASLEAVVLRADVVEAPHGDQVDHFALRDAGVLGALLFPHPEALPPRLVAAVRAQPVADPDPGDSVPPRASSRLQRARARLEAGAQSGVFAGVAAPSLALHRTTRDHASFDGVPRSATCQRENDAAAKAEWERERARVLELEQRAKDAANGPGSRDPPPR